MGRYLSFPFAILEQILKYAKYVLWAVHTCSINAPLIIETEFYINFGLYT